MTSKFNEEQWSATRRAEPGTTQEVNLWGSEDLKLWEPWGVPTWKLSLTLCTYFWRRWSWWGCHFFLGHSQLFPGILCFCESIAGSDPLSLVQAGQDWRFHPWVIVSFLSEPLTWKKSGRRKRVVVFFTEVDWSNLQMEKKPKTCLQLAIGGWELGGQSGSMWGVEVKPGKDGIRPLFSSLISTPVWQTAHLNSSVLFCRNKRKLLDFPYKHIKLVLLFVSLFMSRWMMNWCDEFTIYFALFNPTCVSQGLLACITTGVIWLHNNSKKKLAKDLTLHEANRNHKAFSLTWALKS